MNMLSIPPKNRILIIDDNPAIHADIRKILTLRDSASALWTSDKSLLFGEGVPASEQTVFEIDSAFQGQEGLQKVEAAEAAGHPFALAFVDVRMPPGWDGVETINRIWQRHPQLQVVICTAYSDYSWEEMIRRIGRTDSLVILKKPFDNIEVLQLAHALTVKWHLSHELKGRLENLDLLVEQRTKQLQSANELLKKEIDERMILENALRLSEERFSKAFKASPFPLAIQSLAQEKFVDANLAFQALTGYSHEELIGRSPHDLDIWSNPAERTLMLRTLHERSSVRNMPCQWQAKSNGLHQVRLSVELFDLDGEPLFLTTAQDVTEQSKLENQLREALKMEAVGQLAAGVAHDFNNILLIVKGNACMLLADQSVGSPDTPLLESISLAADRGSKLIRQLLTFSRKQVMQLHPVAIADILASLSDMLPRVLQEDIVIKIELPSPDLRINADASMMDQMLLNLAVNSRDAMPEGGYLRIGAELVKISPGDALQKPESYPGSFVRLRVADTGCGIPDDVLPRIFEPFFSTKPTGKGTGLGLASVYGIAKQHAGWVEVASRPNRGTTFDIFLPLHLSDSEAGSPALLPQPVAGGHETIMVVEDEDLVRSLVGRVLESQGYKVLAANSGKQALDLWPKVREKIALLITDVVMPGGVNGRQLACELQAKDPGLRVIFTSGYSQNMAGKDACLLEGNGFLEKPYEPTQLLKLVRTCLDAVSNGVVPG